jgi:hypothetical protein|tara:strand:+ start:840 stop:1193 length:354 start_codon:yes stop_codon:yes gene_type:complete
MLKECKHCGLEFNLNSTAKKQAGGKINECADCVHELKTETAVKYLGLQAGDGKSNALSIVAFESKEDRSAYSSAWKAVTGFHKGKSCHLSRVQTNIGNRPMRHVSYVGGNGNHKGKA